MPHCSGGLSLSVVAARTTRFGAFIWSWLHRALRIFELVMRRARPSGHCGRIRRSARPSCGWHRTAMSRRSFWPAGAPWHCHVLQGFVPSSSGPRARLARHALPRRTSLSISPVESSARTYTKKANSLQKNTSGVEGSEALHEAGQSGTFVVGDKVNVGVCLPGGIVSRPCVLQVAFGLPSPSMLYSLTRLPSRRRAA